MPHRLLRAIACTLLMGGTGVAPLPGQESAAQAVRGVHERFQAAVIANDVATLGALIAPEYLFITATGDVVNRDEVIRVYSANELVHATYRADSVLVRVLGEDAGIVTAILVKHSRYVAGPRAGTEVSGRFRSTRVYVRRDGQWRVISTHESRIP